MSGSPSQPSTNFTLSLRLIPNRAWLSLGPGWAALAGLLAAWPGLFESDLILRAGLLWLLADPFLGTVWYLLTDCGLWRQLTRIPPAEKMRFLLPYTLKQSSGYRWSIFWTNLSGLQSGEGFTFLAIVLLALILSALLGRLVIVYALLSILLAFVVGDRDGSGGRLLQSIATFLLPYLAGATLAGSPSSVVLLLGLVFWIVYFGMLQLRADHRRGRRLIFGGLIAGVLLLFGLLKPLAATILALIALFFLLWHRQGQPASPGHHSGHLAPFLVAGLLAASLSMGGVL